MKGQLYKVQEANEILQAKHNSSIKSMLYNKEVLEITLQRKTEIKCDNSNGKTYLFYSKCGL